MRLVELFLRTWLGMIYNTLVFLYSPNEFKFSFFMEQMDKKKKMIIVAVGVAMALLLGTVIYFIVAEDEEPKTGLEIDIPKVDEKKIDTISKLDSYDMIPEDSILKDKPLDLGMYGDDSDNSDLEELEMMGNQTNGYSGGSRAQRSSYGSGQGADKEMQALLEMQRKLENESRVSASPSRRSSYGGGSYGGGSYGGGSYGGGSSASTYAQMIDAMKTVGGGGSNKSGAQLAEELSKYTEAGIGEGKVSSEVAAINKEKRNSRNDYFFGASDDFEVENTFIPAETIERAVLLDRAIIPIRIKKTIRVKNLTIPENSVLYGKITFENEKRLKFEIKTYRVNNKIYPVDFKIYDYDGMEGLSLNNRSWAKIPKKVSEDVFRYAYQKGTQTSAFGGDNKINKEELKSIAMLSAANEVAKEIFEKRRILMPEKYQIWIVMNN